MAGNRLGDVGAAVEAVAVEAGFTVVREYVGHGIGTAMHEDPPVPNYGRPGRGLRIKDGLVLAIEPMVNAGSPRPAARRRLDGGHRRRLPLGPLRAHVAVTDDGPEVLTLPCRAGPAWQRPTRVYSFRSAPSSCRARRALEPFSESVRSISPIRW